MTDSTADKAQTLEGAMRAALGQRETRLARLLDEPHLDNAVDRGPHEIEHAVLNALQAGT